MKCWTRRLPIALAGLALVGGGWVGWRFGHPPAPPSSQFLRASTAAPGAVTARFFGTTTLLLDDGRDAVMIDALITHPGLRDALFGKVASDPALVGRVLRANRVGKVDLLLVSHSHYDHVLDAPAIARATGATIVGSPSTREVARGAGIADGAVRVVAGGETLDAGAFHVTVLRSRHSLPDKVPGDIAAPLRPPATLKDYREGGTFAFVIRHGPLRAVVHASANFVPGMYRSVKAEVVFLAVGGLGPKPVDFVARYWDEVVRTTGARLVIPIHWDDFLMPPGSPQVPLRRFMDDFPAAMAKIAPLAARDRVRIAYMPVEAPVDLAAALGGRDR